MTYGLPRRRSDVLIANCDSRTEATRRNWTERVRTAVREVWDSGKERAVTWPSVGAVCQYIGAQQGRVSPSPRRLNLDKTLLRETLRTADVCNTRYYIVRVMYATARNITYS